MKTKHLLFTMAIASAFAACNNDDFVSENRTFRDDKGLLVELNPDFAIGVVKGESVATRAFDEKGSFVWAPVEINDNGQVVTPATLGLCWTGMNNVNAEYSAIGATDYRVFTNYKFEHKGWLYEGETKPAYNQCNKNTPEIKNGQFIPGNGSVAATYSTGSQGSGKQLQVGKGFYTKTANGVDSKFASTDLDFGAGVFKSDLGSIYQGEYIVYFPYSDEFFNGPVQATAPKEVNLTALKVAEKTAAGKVEHDLNSYAAMSQYAFNVGYKSNMDGGVNAEGFSTKILSGGVIVRLTNTADNALDKGIKTVTLYSKNKEFILKQNLSAAAIKGANNDGTKYGTNLYYGEPTATSKTVVASVSTTDANSSQTTLKPEKDNFVDIIIPVLPTSVEDLTVLLTNEENKTAEIKIAGTTAIKPVGQGWTKLNDIDVSKLTFNKVYAMDEASFRAATNNEKSSCSQDLEKEKSIIVRVLGEIEIGAEQPAIAIRGGYTIEGEEGDALIIKGGKTTNIAGQKVLTNPRFIVAATGNFDSATSNEPVLDCDVVVNSAGCCNDFGGRLVIGQATVSKNATITVEGNDDAISALEALNTNKVESTKDGWISFDVEGKTSTVNGTIVNDGEITFGRVDRRAPATGITTKTQTLLNGTIQNRKNMTIFYAGTTANGNDDAKLAVSNTATIQNENGAKFTIEGEFFFDGNGYNHGVIYDRVSSQVTGKLSVFQCDSSLEGNEYVCDVNDPGKRFNDALVSVYKPTTIVRFVENGGKIYDFTKYANKETGTYNSIKKYIVAVESEKPAATYFKGENITLPALVVEGNNVLAFRSMKKQTRLTVDNDLVVAEKGVISTSYDSGVNDKNTIDKASIENLTVKKNFIVDGTARLRVQDVVVGKTFALNGTFAKNGEESYITGNKIAVGDEAAKTGGLFDIQGTVRLDNNTDILVYGDINAGKDAVATIVEATGTGTDMPATVTYSGKNTYANILTNWPKGGPSKMIEE